MTDQKLEQVADRNIQASTAADIGAIAGAGNMNVNQTENTHTKISGQAGNAVALKAADKFEDRHIGLTNSGEANDTDALLKALGYSSIDAFIRDVVPESIYQGETLKLPEALSEAQALEALQAIANKNQPFRSMIGQGYYGTITPTVILRNILENPAWYTAYTPYQPEISQGRLEALLNFQTMVCDLTGLDIANASMLDEGTAAAEAMSLAKRSAKNKANTFFVDQDCLPQTIEVVKTRADAAGYDIVMGDPQTQLQDNDYFGVLLQYPRLFR